MTTTTTQAGGPPPGGSAPSPQRGDGAGPLVAPPSWLRANWALLLAIAALLAVILAPTPEGLSVSGQRMLGVLLFAVIVWMSEVLDYSVSALLIATLMVFLIGFAPDAAHPGRFMGTGAGLAQAFGGFANSALILVAAALFLAAAMTVTGLDKRIALVILSRVGTQAHHVVIGAIAVGIVMAFLVPSTTARVACIVPIMLGIITVFGVNRRGTFASMLMITTVHTASIWNIGIKTAAAQNMVAVGFVERTLNYTISWLEWFVAAAPFAALMTIALYFVMTRMMPSEVREVQGGREAIRTSLDELGPMKPSEKRLLAISLALLAMWSTEGVLHAIDTTSSTIAGVTLMFMPGIGIMTWKEAQPKIPWGTIVLFAIGISLGTALLRTGAATWLANLVVAWFGLASAEPLMILAVLAAFLTIIHLGFASATALASTMIPIVIAMLQGVGGGINVIGMTMLLQFVVSFGFILVVNAPQNMVAYGTDTFDARDFTRTGIVITIVALLLFMLMSVTWWRWLGYVTLPLSAGGGA